MELEKEKLESILEKYYNNMKITSIKILEELKKGSKDYKELKRNLEKLEKTVFYEYYAREKYGDLFIRIEKMIIEEMNDLPLTNRSS